MIGGISGIVTNNLSTRTTETRGNTTRTVIRMYDHEGRERGTISWSERAGANGAKRKKLPYNFKEISAQLMRTTTSDAASRVCAKARRRIAQLMRQKKNGEYDESEVEAALLHAEQMERVAKKRKRNLQTEERAADKIDGKEQIDALEKRNGKRQWGARRCLGRRNCAGSLRRYDRGRRQKNVKGIRTRAFRNRTDDGRF